MRTAEYALEEKKLAKDQAQFEAPTIKRQAEIDYEKAQRALDQSKKNLDTKTKQAVAKMSVASADLGRQQNNLKMVQDAMNGFTINAPSPGMVIYVREWNGKKKGVGSQWNTWDPTVATLPDLTQMESQTYVNEVDVRKLAVGQKVPISLDADPTKKLTGTVTAIANVGEQRPNQDSKVFEVKIEVAKADTTLRPGMTTSNADRGRVDAERAVDSARGGHVSEGGYSYVFKKDGRSVVKQMIETGATNDNEIVVKKGLDEGGSRLSLTAGGQGERQDRDHSGSASRRAGERGRRHGEVRDAAGQAEAPKPAPRSRCRARSETVARLQGERRRAGRDSRDEAEGLSRGDARRAIGRAAFHRRRACRRSSRSMVLQRGHRG